MADSRRVYCDHKTLEDVPLYGLDLLRGAGHANFTPNASNTLAYKLLEEENNRLLKRKDDLALRTAQCKFPNERAMATILEAEKLHLDALVQQREAIGLSYLRETLAKPQEELWQLDRAREHFERGLSHHYGQRAELTVEKMAVNLEGLRKLNADLAAQNESLVKEIAWMEANKAKTLHLAELAGYQKVETFTDDIYRSAKMKQVDAQRVTEATKGQLTFLVRDLEHRLHLLDHEYEAAKGRNDPLNMDPRELANRLLKERRHSSDLVYDKEAFQNVGLALRGERDQLRVTVESLEAALEGDRRNHEIAKQRLFGSRLVT